MKKHLLTLLASSLLAAGSLAHAEELKIAFADNLSSLDPQLNNFAGDRSAGLFFFDMLVSNYYNKLLPSLATDLGIYSTPRCEMERWPAIHRGRRGVFYRAYS